MEFGVWSLEFGVRSLEFGVWSLEFGVILPHPPHLPHLPHPPHLPHLPHPPHLPHRQHIFKTVVANYALDKLKIEIAGNSDPADHHLSSGIDWAISSANFLPSRQFM